MEKNQHASTPRAIDSPIEETTGRLEKVKQPKPIPVESVVRVRTGPISRTTAPAESSPGAVGSAGHHRRPGRRERRAYFVRFIRQAFDDLQSD